MRMATRLVAAVALLAWAGCGGGEEHDDDGTHHHGIVMGDPTGAACPEGSTLRYDDGSGTPDGTFGKTFFATNCLDCHSASLSGEARHGAPADHNFDTVEDIRAMRAHIDQMAAGGPNAVNRLMPPTNGPTDEERMRLGEWLACGAP